ncbi:RNA polymerase sigma factor [Dictyobacter arantiisoli]|uniref:RNA polymerase sigma factor n=1 Tax=Dictyobacter arantiisoli TaxID=2014874 RepID=A0A5A5TEL8_9CHLR|nr:sigma-70 family RNA polymerase sigma factor [Dictyobacter arantiisoli]GCF09523.1 RNA polymerase sigma factor [Dictyobacter arantiisoli]
MAYWTGRSSSSRYDDGKQALSVDILVKRAQDGDQAAFEMLYARFNDQITTYLSRMVGNDGVGCELTQETFLKAWSALPGLRNPELFVRWIYRIALNCARDYQKRQMQMQTVTFDESNSDDEHLQVEGPESEVAQSELLQLALAQVSPLYRACLILYIIEDLPQRQIAERLNIKENCVSKYVSRGKEELRQIYYQLQKGKDKAPSGRKGR